MITRRKTLLGAGALAAGAGQAHAQTAPLYVESGDRFSFQDDDFQLADVLSPSAFQFGAPAEPFFEAARDHLLNRLTAGAFDISDAGPLDRWGRRTVRVYPGDQDLSVSEALVTAGAVRVAPMSDDYDQIRNLLEREARARAEGAGIWALEYYHVLPHEDSGRGIARFGLVQGVVKQATEAASRLFLNFGADYRTDFTASVAIATHRKWLKAGIDHAAFEGREVMVRGLIASINGPSIDLTHPLQVTPLSSISV